MIPWKEPYSCLLRTLASAGLGVERTGLARFSVRRSPSFPTEKIKLRAWHGHSPSISRVPSRFHSRALDPQSNVSFCESVQIWTD